MGILKKETLLEQMQKYVFDENSIVEFLHHGNPKRYEINKLPAFFLRGSHKLVSLYNLKKGQKVECPTLRESVKGKGPSNPGELARQDESEEEKVESENTESESEIVEDLGALDDLGGDEETEEEELDDLEDLESLDSLDSLDSEEVEEEVEEEEKPKTKSKKKAKSKKKKKKQS